MIIFGERNHDLNYLKGSNTHDQIKEWLDADSLKEHIEEECSKMASFYYYAGVLQCFTDKQSLVYVKELKYEDKIIPVEAKADIHTRAKSYRQYCKKYSQRHHCAQRTA